MRILWHSLHRAWFLGTDQVVAVTTLALERYLLRQGVRLRRLGEPHRVKGDRLIALSLGTFQPACPWVGVIHPPAAILAARER